MRSAAGPAAGLVDRSLEFVSAAFLMDRSPIGEKSDKEKKVKKNLSVPILLVFFSLIFFFLFNFAKTK